MSFERKLIELGLTLPAPPKPVATYIPAVLVGELLFLSGVIPFQDGKLAFEGKLGRELTVEQGYEAARVTLLNALAIVRHELGTLDRVKKIVRMTGHVASADGFVQHPGGDSLSARLCGAHGPMAAAPGRIAIPARRACLVGPHEPSQ